MSKSGMFAKAFKTGVGMAIVAIVIDSAYNRGKRDAYRECTNMFNEAFPELNKV